jgi:ubiquinone/menaquinone biosynthesis C-methylase UbiE
MDNQFIDIPFTQKTVDRYYIRTTIFSALKEAAAKFNGRLLDIGCGKMPYKSYLLAHSAIDTYVGLDIENALLYDHKVQPDVTWDGKNMPFEDAFFECAFGTEVLEHCPDPELVLKEVHRVLKPDGIFFFTVPFLWNLHEVPHDEYRYTPFSLQRHLSNSGFQNIEIKATGGWHAAMGQMLGLWVKRAPMSKAKRKYLIKLVLPVMKYLFKLDKGAKNFKEGQMITGLSGIAYKR